MIVHAKIQKWGNGLALRIGGVLREIPHFKAGTAVDIEVSTQGLTIKKSLMTYRSPLPYSESTLLKNLSPNIAHADLLATPFSHEIDPA